MASEYQNTMPSATGARTPQSHPSRAAAYRNTADETTTKTAASRRLMTPRGSSRIAVRGLSASKRASTARLNPMAALRALTMQRTIQPTLRPRERLGAPRQQRTGERERQREHRVAEADEREIGRQSGHAEGASVGSHATSGGAMPETRYSSTSTMPSGTRTLMSAARRPGSMVP